MTNGVLVDNIVDIADSFVIFYPASISDLDLSVFDQVLKFLLTGTWKIIIPIFEKDCF